MSMMICQSELAVHCSQACVRPVPAVGPLACKHCSSTLRDLEADVGLLFAARRPLLLRVAPMVAEGTCEGVGDLALPGCHEVPVFQSSSARATCVRRRQDQACTGRYMAPPAAADVYINST